MPAAVVRLFLAMKFVTDLFTGTPAQKTLTGFIASGQIERHLRRLGARNAGAGSLRVESGPWAFCSRPDYAGECRTFSPGDYANLPWDLDRVASGHKVLETVSSLR